MKRYLAAGLALALALTLASCDVYAKEGDASSGASSTQTISDGSEALSALADASIPEPFSAILPEDGSQPQGEDHDHQTAEADNIVPHDPVGYCGNTVTIVSQNGRLVDDPWEASFWGDDSVALTDLLIHLDYSKGICRCLPEYDVTTEFSEEPYGVNLSDSYARHGDKQVDLTPEQVELIRDILDRNRPD